MTRTVIAAVTHTGLVRRRNEDHLGVTGLRVDQADGAITSAVIEDSSSVAVVADGLGGHPAGEVASRLAVAHVLSNEPHTPGALVDAVVDANRLIASVMSAADGSLGMGTTVVAALMHPGGVAVVNVGDSAAFELVENRLVQLSVDDVPAGSAGLPGLPSALVTQTLGGASHFEPIEPHVYEDELLVPRRLLLCTDGLTNFVERPAIARALASEDVVTAATQLIELALEAGAPDNATVVVLDAEWPDHPKEAP